MTSLTLPDSSRRPATTAGRRSRPVDWIRLLSLLSLPLFLLLWWLIAASGRFPATILVPPRAVVAAMIETASNGELATHLGATFWRLGIGVSVGTLMAIAFGFAAGASRVVDHYTAPLFTVIRTVPSIAFIPIFILLFGIGETFKLLVVGKAVFFPVALAAREAVRGIPRAYIDVAASYRLPLLVRVRRLIVPATLPPVLNGVRLGIGRSWGVLVGAELIASEVGLGQMMELGRQMFRLDIVMLGVIIAGLVGFGLDRAIRILEARFTAWKAA